MIKGFCFFYWIAAILGILFVNTKNIWILIILAIMTIFTYQKASIQPIFIMGVCFLFFCFYRTNTSYHVSKTYKHYEVAVTTTKENYCLVKYQKHIFLLYINEKCHKNDILTFDANLTKIPKDSNLYGFEFRDYLKNKRVFYQFENVNNLMITTKKPPLSDRIVSLVTSKLDDTSNTFVSMLLFNDQDIDQIAYDDLKEINALHLFVVSGFHILFLNKLLIWLFSSIFKKKASYLSFGILLLYLYLLDFSISAYRAVFCLILAFFDKNQKMSSLDRLSLSGFVLIILEPLVVFSLSFIMSYLLATILILSKNIFKEHKKTTNLFLLSFICFMVMFPIQLLINYKINFISFFSNILLGFIVPILFVLSLISTIVSVFNGAIFSKIYQLFFNLIHCLNQIFPSLIFGKPPTILVVGFYILCIILFKLIEEKKYREFYFSFGLSILIVLVMYNKNYFVGYEQVTFLDVYQGDCTLIESKWNQGVILIDTGGIKNYDIASKKIMPHLIYKGIRKIDIVAISHDDYDHNGALKNLKKKIPILKVIDNPATQEINLGSIHLTNLNHYYTQYKDNNNQSLVLYGKIANTNFLFTGDIDSKIEKKLIDDYPNLAVDILKVAHHGSRQSTCCAFIEHIQPKVAIISVGQNHYGHPSNEVLKILYEHQVKVLRTDLNGTILISYRYFFYYLISAK